MNTLSELELLLSRRIAILDGAMGTMIQPLKLSEEDFRGAEFRDHSASLGGCNDILCITQPQAIAKIHRQFLDSGADIIETNTFNATRYPMADYALESHVTAINAAAAKLARQVADQFSSDTGKPAWVAGSIGPTNKSASLSPNVNDPGFRAVSFDDLVVAYQDQARALIAGGVDLLLAETAFDTLNLKAALFAFEDLFEQGARRVPVIGSTTITDRSGRTLSGQTIDAFWVSVAHFNLFGVGINCALGAKEMQPHVQDLSRCASTYVVSYPNAGLPNEFGEYDESPEAMAKVVGEFAEAGWLNIAGGCCGTTPDHIAAIRESVLKHGARKVPKDVAPTLRLSGLEPFVLTPESNFTLIGERTNVTGSKKFRQLILEDKYEDAVEVARQQVTSGANVLDVCMDDGMLDGEIAMTKLLRLIASEPDISRVPIMIDSSRFSILLAGLKCLQGKGIVNSISLKEGEAEFIRQASLIRRYGAAVVVMAFDESGQATSVESRVAICQRSYDILTQKVGFPPEDIIFDPNILTVGTGMEEHNDYAVSFIQSLPEIKKRMPLVRTSGGLSNVSFSFRGNNAVREAMHSAFLYHAVKNGLDMAIVNAGQLAVYEEIPRELLTLVEDVLLNRSPDATEKLIAFSATYEAKAAAQQDQLAWRKGTLQERITHALVAGIDEFVPEDVAEALRTYPTPLSIIEQPLMAGMNVVGELFGAGKMFLPQVVKSARVMKKAVAILEPLMEASGQAAGAKGTMVIATVKGDVHDIGKNIVGVVLRCNGYRVIDLGVMVPVRDILDTAIREKADVIGLSGLITPSLDQMIHVAEEMERGKQMVPLLIGGATTSSKHTAVKIAPVYSGLTVHVGDASLAATVMTKVISKADQVQFAKETREKQNKVREQFWAQQQTRPKLSAEEAHRRRLQIAWRAEDLAKPPFYGIKEVVPQLADLVPYIDWSPFFHAWEIRGTYPKLLEDKVVGEKAKELLHEGRQLLDRLVRDNVPWAKGVYGFFPAASDGQTILVYQDESRSKVAKKFTMPRQEMDVETTLCLADFVAPVDSGLADCIGAFAVTAGLGADEMSKQFAVANDDYQAIMVKVLADRLAEAFAEYLHHRVRIEWGLEPAAAPVMAQLLKEEYRSIRPAFGYPSCPDHAPKQDLFELLHAEKIGMALTEGFSMTPGASVSGLYFAHPQARYFSVGDRGW